MKNDVQTLIGSLTTQRNAIDRAIASLKQLSDVAKPEPAKVETKPTRRTRAMWRIPIETKAAIVARMAAAGAGNQTAEAGRLAKEFGLKPSTIYLGWHRWQREQQSTQPVAFDIERTEQPDYAAVS